MWLLNVKPGTDYVPSQRARTYYHPDGGIPETMFDMIRDWLQQCETEHQECRYDSTTQMPTRLVDVGTLDSSTVHLIETNDGLHAPYLTLSHCWGRNANVYRRTTRGNLEIPFEELPRTFRDAVTVTRKLRFTYLWIDSLCIIQGDEGDWERESANMASFYANGVLNLAASYSADSSGGLMLERSQLHVSSCVWKHQTRPVSSRNPWGGWMKARQVCWAFDPQSEFVTLGLRNPLPLTSRGWVLQENVLSPRTLHFLPGEIIWECRQLSARESFYCSSQSPAGLPHEFKGKAASFPETILVTRNGSKNFLRPSSGYVCGKQTALELATRAKSDKEPGSQLYRQWYEMVTQYSRKHLTRSGDRLPAIWALAQRFQDRTGDEYCSGLWKDDLLTGLLFKRFQPRPSSCHTSQLSCGPSWSWASTECRVEFERMISPLSSSSAESDRLPDAFLQKLVIVPTEPSSLSMGRTRQAELEIRTYARDVVVGRRNRNTSPGERVAKAMGISTIFNHDLHSNVWHAYEELGREYESSHRQGRPYHDYDRLNSQGLSAKDAWIQERTFGNSHLFNHLNRGTDCYFGWTGAKFIEEARWAKREADDQRGGRDKILRSGLFDLDFDTKALAESYTGKAVLCLHIKGTSGLLIELDASSETYRRIGVYGHVGWYGLDLWEPKVVTIR